MSRFFGMPYCEVLGHNESSEAGKALKRALRYLKWRRTACAGSMVNTALTFWNHKQAGIAVAAVDRWHGRAT